MHLKTAIKNSKRTREAMVIMGVMSAIMIINTMLWFSLVAVFLTQKRIRSIFERFQGVFNKTLGGLLIALGIKVALTEK